MPVSTLISTANGGPPRHALRPPPARILRPPRRSKSTAKRPAEPPRPFVGQRGRKNGDRRAGQMFQQLGGFGDVGDSEGRYIPARRQGARYGHHAVPVTVGLDHRENGGSRPTISRTVAALWRKAAQSTSAQQRVVIGEVPSKVIGGHRKEKDGEWWDDRMVGGKFVGALYHFLSSAQPSFFVCHPERSESASVVEGPSGWRQPRD